MTEIINFFLRWWKVIGLFILAIGLIKGLDAMLGWIEHIRDFFKGGGDK